MSAVSSDAARPRQYANGLARRDQILDAAATLFVRCGFRAVSLREIAALVGISHQGVRRHFASTDEILLALLTRYEDRNRAFFMERPDVAGRYAFAPELAALNASIPGYVPLFAALAGEATAPEHPAHDYFRRRYLELQEAQRELTGDTPDALPLDTLVLSAAWDGLQLQSLYDPVDVPGLLRRRLALHGLVEEASPAAAPDDPPACLPEPADESAGYAPGRANRRAIVADATRLFAAGGFQGTSLTQVAERVGVGKSTLLHHFATKEDLLLAVLEHRDAEERAWFEQLGNRSGLEALRSVPRLAAAEQREAGMLQLYCVLVGEASGPEHPAHDYFTQRMRLRRGALRQAFADLGTESDADGLDPAFEAVWLSALWDGLQFQWLYDRSSVDVPAALTTHLASVGVTPADHEAAGAA